MKVLKNIFFASLVFALLGMVACFAKKTPDFVLVNVLDKEYYDDCHIEGSINVPFMELEKYAQEHWDKENTQIVLYCGNYKCTASGVGVKMLQEQGFKHVWAYEGGSAEWMHQNLPVKGTCKEVYLTDYELPEGMVQDHEITISAQDLLAKMRQFK